MKQLLRDLKRIPTFSVTSLFPEGGLGKCRHFYVRWCKHPADSRSWEVEFAVRESFDRWANSTNFHCELNYCYPYRPDILKGYRWMVKVLQSGLFNWNSYFHTLGIQCDYIANRKARKSPPEAFCQTKT